VRDKNRLTQELVQQLGPESSITVQEATNTWWSNIRKTGGMRLTDQGYHAFSEILNLARYEWTIDDPLKFDLHIILALDRKIQMPYYIQAVKRIPKKVIFFSSQEAVLINLYGDLAKFLDNYQT
jgi:hypothetical protein